MSGVSLCGRVVALRLGEPGVGIVFPADHLQGGGWDVTSADLSSSGLVSASIHFASGREEISVSDVVSAPLEKGAEAQSLGCCVFETSRDLQLSCCVGGSSLT